MLTHIEERPAIQSSPVNASFAAQILEQFSDARLASNIRFWQSSKLLSGDISDKLICEVKLDSCGQGCVDNQLRRFILRSTSSDAIDNSILARKSVCQRGKRRKVGGLVDDSGRFVGCRFDGR